MTYKQTTTKDTSDKQPHNSDNLEIRQMPFTSPPSLTLFLSLSFSLSLCLSLSISFNLCLPLSLSFVLSLCFFFFLCLPTYLCLFFYISLSKSISLFLCFFLYFCISFSISVFLSLFIYFFPCLFSNVSFAAKPYLHFSIRFLSFFCHQNILRYY